MNYFTPDLIAMGQSEDDDTLNEQERLWEGAGARYRAYLDPLRASFPKGLKRLTSRYYLHDARVREIATRGHYLSVRLQLDTPPHSLLDLRYRLLSPASIETEALPPNCRGRGPGVSWMYGEISRLSEEQVQTRSHDWIDRKWYDLVRKGVHEGEGAPQQATNGAAEWPFWQHAFLLSNGWEITLAFRDIEVEEWTPVIVPHSPYSEQQRVESVTRSA